MHLPSHLVHRLPARFSRILWVLGTIVLLVVGIARGDVRSDAQAQASFLITRVDTVGNVGFRSSVAVTSAQRPVISYYDATNGDLKIAFCGDDACLSGTTLRTVDTLGDVGAYPSLALDRDDRPVIAYYDLTNQDLKVAICDDTTCTTTTIRTLDTTGAVGSYPSLALTTDQIPVIAYYDLTHQDLKIAVCSDRLCSTAPDLRTLDATGSVGTHPSIALAGDQRPVIADFDMTNADLKVVRCGDPECSANNVVTTADSNGGTGSEPSLALSHAGLPVIGYITGPNGSIKLAQCAVLEWTSGTTFTIVTSPARGGTYSDLALTSDDQPIMSFSANGDTALGVVIGGNPACTSSNEVTTVDANGLVGSFTAVAVLDGARPIISYYDATNADLKVAVAQAPVLPSPTASMPPSPTPMPSMMPTATATTPPTATAVATATDVPTESPTTMPTASTTPIAVPTETPTRTATPTGTSTVFPTATIPPETPTMAATSTATIAVSTATPSSTATATQTPPVTPSTTPTDTPTVTPAPDPPHWTYLPLLGR